MEKKEKSLLRDLVSDPKWQIIMNIADEKCKRIQGTSNLKDSDAETLKSTYLNEGKVRGIREFIQEIYAQIS